MFGLLKFMSNVHGQYKIKMYSGVHKTLKYTFEWTFSKFLIVTCLKNLLRISKKMTNGVSHTIQNHLCYHWNNQMRDSILVWTF